MMASNAVKTVRAVKPHIPLIKFPSRKGGDGKNAASTLIKDGSSASVAASSTSSTTKPTGSTPRGSGIDSSELPNKYRRKPLSEEEMELIEHGGPL